MDEWIEVFKAGRHSDSQGRVRDWSVEDLDHAVATYDPGHHEAPLVVGHPKDNAPAYGWVEKAKREGDTLFVKSKQVDPAFREMLQAGRFKKRSISFYPDGTIRHIGFLGAQPPAVKGLKDAQFQQGQHFTQYEYDEGQTVKPAPIHHPDPEEIDMGELEETKRKLADAEKAQQKAEADDAEAQKKLKEADDARKAQEAQFAEQRRQQAATERKRRFDELVAKGKVLPAEEKAVLEFANALEAGPTEYEFTEGAGKKTLGQHFWAFLEGRGSHGLFQVTKPGDDQVKKEETEFAEDEKLAAQIAGKKEEKK